MSSIDKKTIEHIAKLARLQITDSEAEEYSQQFTKILAYFEQISKVDTQGVVPLVTPTDMKAIWRPDEVKMENTSDEMVANAPQRTGNLFTVPPVV